MNSGDGCGGEGSENFHNSNFLKEMKINQVVVRFLDNREMDPNISPDQKLTYGTRIHDDPIFQVDVVMNSKGELFSHPTNKSMNSSKNG